MPLPHFFDPEILREYDIRGQIDKNLYEVDAYALGHAFATYIAREIPNKKTHTICIGHDGRHSSPALAKRLMDGLLECGVNILFIGLGPTPMLYYSVKELKADAGIMVTGSHNPPDYNGFKMTTFDHPIFGDAIQEIGAIASKKQRLKRDNLGIKENIDIKLRYVHRLVQD